MKKKKEPVKTGSFCLNYIGAKYFLLLFDTIDEFRIVLFFEKPIGGC